MKHRRLVLLTALISAPLACKTADVKRSGPAEAKDFNTGASSSLTIPFDNSFSFCPNAQKFNIVNAYWLTLASSYVYATKENLTAVADSIRAQSPSLKVDFISSPDSINPLNASTQALWIENDSAVVVAFRGTPLDRIDPQDIVTDANALLVPFDGQANLGNVHKGFNEALDSVWSQLEAPLARTQKPIFFTGHSLGAALATLATARLTMLPQNNEIKPFVRGLYTIGSPRVGDRRFVASFRGATGEIPLVRMRNEQDIVTRMPPAELGYAEHVSDVYYLSSSGRIYTNTADANFARYRMTPPVAATMDESFIPWTPAALTAHVPTSYFNKIATEYSQFKATLGPDGVLCADDAAFYRQIPDPSQPVAVTGLNTLRGLTDAQLSTLYASRTTAGPIPSASTPGVPVLGTGLAILRPGNNMLNGFAANFWDGKTFRTNNGVTTLNNRLASGLRNEISAVVTEIPRSLTGDGHPSILLNYQQSDYVSARLIRDEIRQVAPGIYLGRAYLINPLQQYIPFTNATPLYQFVTWFALDFTQPPPGP